LCVASLIQCDFRFPLTALGIRFFRFGLRAQTRLLLRLRISLGRLCLSLGLTLRWLSFSSSAKRRWVMLDLSTFR
jgi:hypothetical protein